VLLVRDFLADQKVVRHPDAPTEPAVSVILPTFQRCAGGLLRRALDSVLSQGFRDLELIVVDDGSVDGTLELLLALQRADPRLVLVRHELNCGLPALRVNEGIELARGRWIAFQFDDDEWLDGGLAALVEVADGATEPSVVFGRADWVADSWREELPRRSVDLKHLSSHNDIANNSVLVARQLFELRGLYDPHVSMRRLCDWDLWLRLILHAPFVAVDRLVSCVPFVSDPTAIGVTAPVDLPLVRYIMSIPRDDVLSLGRWRDYQVDALELAGVALPHEFAARCEREQLSPFRTRFMHLGAPPSVRRPRAAAAPKVLVCTADEYDWTLDLGIGHYDAFYRDAGGYKQVFHHLWELDRAARPRVAVDLLLCFQTSSPPSTDVVAEMVDEGTPTAYYLDESLIGVLDHGLAFTRRAHDDPVRVAIQDQLARVDAVWSTSPELSELVRSINPRQVPHRHSVPEDWLPDVLPPRGSSGRIRIGGIGTADRHDDYRSLWRAIEAVAGRWQDRLEFEFWGLEVERFPPIASPVVRQPLPSSWPTFLERLRRRHWDVLLAPFHPRARMAAVPDEYCLAAVFGALGIFSDSPAFGALHHGVDCLTAEDTAAAWEAGLEEALTMPLSRFDAIRQALVAHVRQQFTAEAQMHLHAAACRATALHAATRRQRVDGIPCVLYVAPAERDPSHRTLVRAAEMVRQYGIASHVLCATEATELQADLTERDVPWSAATFGLLRSTASPVADDGRLRSLIAGIRPACVHSAAPVATLAEVCSTARVPLVVGPPRAWADPMLNPARAASELLALYSSHLEGCHRP
jgi:hypothetical protein